MLRATGAKRWEGLRCCASTTSWAEEKQPYCHSEKDPSIAAKSIAASGTGLLIAGQFCDKWCNIQEVNFAIAIAICVGVEYSSS